MVQRTSSMINIIRIVALGDDKNQFGTRDEDERGWCFWRGKNYSSKTKETCLVFIVTADDGSVQHTDNNQGNHHMGITRCHEVARRVKNTVRV